MIKINYLILIILIFTFFSCTKDKVNAAENIVGKWSYVDYYIQTNKPYIAYTTFTKDGIVFFENEYYDKRTNYEYSYDSKLKKLTMLVQVFYIKWTNPNEFSFDGYTYKRVN